MLSAGMLTDFASATIVRRRGLLSTSPPPARAATVSSLMMRVKSLPRLASSAPFLCLIVCHFEWPDIMTTSKLQGYQSHRRYDHSCRFAYSIGAKANGLDTWNCPETSPENVRLWLGPSRKVRVPLEGEKSTF